MFRNLLKVSASPDSSDEGAREGTAKKSNTSVLLGRWFDTGQQPQQFAQSGECTVPKVGSTIRLRWASEALRFTGGDLEAQFPAPSLSLHRTHL